MADVPVLIMFGDGSQALYIEEKNERSDRDGVKILPILVAPSEELKKKYSLSEDDLPVLNEDGKRCTWMNYPIKQIDWLNRSKNGAVIFIWCAFDRSNTPVMRKVGELLEWDKIRDVTEGRLRGALATKQRELEDLLQNHIELLRQMRGMSDVVTKDLNEEEDGSD